MLHSRFSRLGGLMLVGLGVAFFLMAEGLDTPPEPGKATIPSYEGLPLSFELNQGQTDDQVQYLARGSGFKLSLSSSDALLTLRAPLGDEASGIAEQHTLRIGFPGATPTQVEAVDELPGKVNYLIGNDPQNWRTNIPTYGAIIYRDLYPGVDLLVSGDRRRPELRFVVAPGADPDSIELEFGGAEAIDLDVNGDVLLRSRNGPIRQDVPLAYQIIDGVKQRIQAGYLLLGGDSVGYTVGSYDSEQHLFISVGLIGSDSLREGTRYDTDGGFRVAMDAQGNTYLSGRVLVAGDAGPIEPAPPRETGSQSAD